MPFTKLDSGILQSSIMAEDPATFKVWIALLASCHHDGTARVSSTFLAAVCRLDIKVVDKALAILKAPDPRSRSKAEEGRRIREVDGGFFLINYQRYRSFDYSEGREAERKRDYRFLRKRIKEEGEEEVEAECPTLVPDMSQMSQDVPQDKSLITKKFMDRWNDFARKEGLPTIKEIPSGSARERHLLARIKDGFDFEKALEAIHYQGFLKGQNERGWVVNFDWILSPSNYLKLIEGNYTKVERGGGRKDLDDPMTGHSSRFKKQD